MKPATSAILALAVTGAFRTGAAPYYRNSFEEKLDVQEWVTVVQYDVHTLALVEENPHSGRRCAKIDYTVTKKGHRSYFKVPLDLEVVRGASYVVDGYLWLDAPTHVNVALGIVWGVEYAGKSMSDGCYTVTSPVEARREWVRLLSRELRPALVSNVDCTGFSPLSRQTFTGLYLSVLGQMTPGERVTLYLDDLSLTPATDEIKARWAEQDRRAQEELDYAGSPETEIEKTFHWGVIGALDGMARWVEVPMPVCAAVVARDWQEDFFDGCARLGGLIQAGGRPLAEQQDDLQELLDVTARHGFRMQTSVHLTGYSKSGAHDPSADRSQAEAALERVVSRCRDHPGLLAWYILDEPRAEGPALRDHWIWAKKRIEALDPHHPVTAALNNPRAVCFYAPWSAITQIDRYPLLLGEQSSRDDTGIKRHGAMTGGAVCQAAWAAGARTVWFVPQAYGDFRKRRLPTPAELRLQTYITLAHGATGIFLYSYQSRPLWHVAGGERNIADIVLARPAEMGREVRQLGRVIPVIAPVLLGTRWVADAELATEAQALEHFGVPAIQAQLNTGPDYDLLVVYNIDVETRQDGTVRMPPGLVRGRTLTNLHTRESVRVGPDGSFAVSLDPGDGRFFALASAAVAERLYNDMDQRRYRKLARIDAAELREARAVGIDTAAAERQATAADARLQAGEARQALALLEAARAAVRQGLAAQARYADCEQGLAGLQATISKANAAFEDYIMQIPWDRHNLEYSQPRRIAAAMYKPHGDLILAAARHWVRLRYGLMNGRLAECDRALPACRQLAEQTQALVDVLVSGKKHETNAMWQLYHPITPRLRELMDRCEQLTKPLESVSPTEGT